MSTPALLDFETLLAPIPGDNPAGKAVPFATREIFDKARKEINPNTFDADDPLRPKDIVRADWGLIVEKAQEVLTETTKDMLTAARLTEALVKLHGEELQGFAGLRDGLHLMRRMLDECWDRLYPPIEEEGDEEVRAAAFSWLDDNDRGARFPMSIRTTPMVSSGDKGLSWKDWKDSSQASATSSEDQYQQEEGQGETKLTFNDVVRETPREICQHVADDLTECLTEIVELDRVLEAKLGTYAPSISNMRQAIYDCQVLAKHMVEQKGPAEDASIAEGFEDVPAGNGEITEGPGQQAPAAGRTAMNTRAQVYQTIAEAARVLRQLEPHSPIPFMLERAVELGSLTFPELMKEFIRNPEVLSVLGRELGVKGMSEEF
jgi:type VI secretion system protein ImpA